MPSRLVALALLATVACGSDGDPTSSESSPAAKVMTKAEYVAAANAICVDFEKKAEEIAEPESPSEFPAAIESILELMDQGNASLRALEAPPEHKAEIEGKFLKPNDQQAAALRAALPKIEAAAESDDAATATQAFAEAFNEVGEVAEDADKWATDFGLTECTSS